MLLGAVKEVARPAESGKTEAKSSSAKRSSDETRGQEISSTLQLTVAPSSYPGSLLSIHRTSETCAGNRRYY